MKCILQYGVPTHLLDGPTTRQERIDAFVHEGTPPAVPTTGNLCEDHIGKYVIPFLCRWRMAEAKTDRSIETAVIGWREAK